MVDVHINGCTNPTGMRVNYEDPATQCKTSLGFGKECPDIRYMMENIQHEDSPDRPTPKGKMTGVEDLFYTWVRQDIGCEYIRHYLI
jgi:hypothetical protein